MKAVVMDRAGGPEVLQCVELPDSVAAPGQVLVKVAAAGVNFVDTEMPYPKTLGVEGAGRVMAVGEGVEDIQMIELLCRS